MMESTTNAKAKVLTVKVKDTATFNAIPHEHAAANKKHIILMTTSFSL